LHNCIPYTHYARKGEIFGIDRFKEVSLNFNKIKNDALKNPLRIPKSRNIFKFDEADKSLKLYFKANEIKER
jgi:hypothetical protein